MSELVWSAVRERHGVPLEFGACHVNFAWRRHVQDQHKYHSIEEALFGAKDGIAKLLQSVGGNRNSANYPERGTALFAAIWYPEAEWALLCDALTIGLIDRASIEALEVCKSRNDVIAQRLRELLYGAELSQARPFEMSVRDAIGA